MRIWLITLLALASCNKEAPTIQIRPVKTIQVFENAAAKNQLIFPGTLRAFKRADLSFRVDGTVIVRDIFVGYRAPKDQVLIQLDPREYEIAVKKAKGKVESTQAQLDFAERDYERMKKIFEKDPGAISASMLDRKKEGSNQLKAELSIAKSDLEKAEDDLSYTSLKAPFDGIIAAIYVENHEQVRAKETVLRFLDLTNREMEINVPERYMNELIEKRTELRFTVSLDAFPNKIFKASVKEIGTEAASTTQTYPVILALDNVPDELSLLAGMNGKAFLNQPKGSPTNPSFTIPKSAIFTENGEETYVWVVDQNTVHKRAVGIEEEQRGENVRVTNGLAAGDRIVVAGTSFLREGQTVKVEGELPKP